MTRLFKIIILLISFIVITMAKTLESPDEITVSLGKHDYYKVDNDVVLAYRNYYVGEKSKIARWNKNRFMPLWFFKKGRMINV